METMSNVSQNLEIMTFMYSKEIRELRGKLYRKICECAQEIGQIIPEGFNKSSNYKFISYEQINARIRNLAVKWMLNITSSVVACHDESYVSKDGKQMIRTNVAMRIRVTDTETGYFEEFDWHGADQDYGGKSFGKAVTEGEKRFLFKIFKISSCADIDSDFTTNEHEPIDAVEFVSQHEELQKICAEKGFGRKLITKICEEMKYDVELIRAEFEATPTKASK